MEENNNPQPPATGSDIENAKRSVQDFVQEMSVQPKPAIGSGTSAGTTQPDAAVQESTAPASGSNGGIFSSDFYKKLLPGNDAPKPETEKQPEPEPYKPFTEDPPPFNDDKDLIDNRNAETGKKRALTMVKMFDMMISRGLAMYDTTGDFEKYKLQDNEKLEIADGLNEWNPKILEEMPGYALFATAVASVYGPMVYNAHEARKINLKNMRIASQVKPTGNTMQQQVGRVVPFNTNLYANAAVVPGKGERTRYEIHADGTYRYSRKFADRPTKFVPIGSADSEKVDLADLEAIKHVILKNGGWKSVAKKIGVTEEWMIQRGLDTNNPKIAD